MRPSAWELGLLAALLAATPVRAQQLGRVDVHGFGTWAYGKTGSTNAYLFGNRDGAYNNVDFALNVGVALTERLRVNGQISAVEEPSIGEGERESTTTELDFLYAEYQLGDHLRVRVGDVKHPFGIYTEVYDLGTVRPFLALPQGVYGGSGFVGEAYKGLGLTGDVLAGSWRFAYDVYGGGMTIGESAGGLDYLMEGADAVQGDELEYTNQMVGGRLVVHTPVEGLSFGGSAYNGRPIGEREAPRRSVFGGQLEYVGRALTLRSETAYEDTEEMEHTPMQILGGYVEAAYKLDEHWQVAGLYDRLYTRLQDVDVSQAPSLLQHTSLGAGVNYWLTSSLVFKASYQGITGNRFASPDPEVLAAVVRTGQLDKHTALFTIGAQMTF